MVEKLNPEPLIEKSENVSDDIIKVSQWDVWDIADAPSMIGTTALGPCVGVIIYDQDSKQAMVGNFMDPEIGDFKGMLEDAVSRFGDKEKLQIWVGGQEKNFEDAPYFSKDKAIRSFVRRELEKHVFDDSQITVKWQEFNYITNMKIATVTGIVEYDERDGEGGENIY